MTDLDEKIAARRKARKKKSKRPKGEARHEPVGEVDSVGSGQLKSPPELQSEGSLGDSSLKMSRRRDRQPQAGGGQLKSPPEAMACAPEDSSLTVGAYNASNDDVSPAERLKFGATSGGDFTSSGKTKVPGAYSSTSSDVCISEKLKSGSPSSSSMAAAKPPPEAVVGAHSLSKDQISSAERLKLGSTGGGGGIPGGRKKKSRASKESFGSESYGSNVHGVYSQKTPDMSNSERLKFGASSGTSGSASTPGAFSEKSSERTKSERLKFRAPLVAPSTISMPGAHSARSTDMTSSERLKFGAASTGVGSTPGVHATKSSHMSNSERIKFGEGSATSSGAASMPGAHAAKSSDVTNSERLKFGAARAASPNGDSTPSVHVDVERVKLGTAVAASSGASKIPGAHAERDLSHAERMKYGATPLSSATALMPKVQAERSPDKSRAERVKIGSNSSVGSGGSGSYSDAKILGAHVERDMTNAERLKFRAASASPGTGVMLRAWHERSSDLSHAERVKLGSNSSVGSGGHSEAKMPGAEPTTADDMSNAERVKFGSSSGMASMPGAQAATDVDVSNAERVKFGSGPSVAGSIVGAMSASTGDLSNAERVKFGTTSAPLGAPSIPGIQEATLDELSAAARLKFGEDHLPSHGIHDDSDIDTRAAEALKFSSVGLTAPAYENERSARGGFRPESEPVARGGLRSSGNMRSSDTSASQNYSLPYSEGDDGIDIPDVENDVGLSSYRGSVRTKKDDDDEYNEEEDYGVEVEELGNIAYSNYDREISPRQDPEGRKDSIDGWRSLCILSSCISCIIIIGLSAGLGRVASRKGSEEDGTPLAVVAVSTSPSTTPTIAPTMPLGNYAWCYESNEVAALENDRYASLRSALVRSGISNETDFSYEASYQRKSLCWLSIGDRLQLDANDPFLDQRYALATIFFSFGEPVKLSNDGWLSGKPECEWTLMIECDSRTGTTVNRLNLRGNDLDGMLPKEMDALDDITYLDLSTNQLHGDISLATRNWKKLEQLKLSANVFDSIPMNMSSWKALKHLDISFNEIDGPIPESLTLSTQLVYLDISGNDFNGSVSAGFGNLTLLKKFYLHSNSLGGSIPQSVCDLRSGELTQLTVDCGLPAPEVECKCCTVCDDYDVDRNPFD